MTTQSAIIAQEPGHAILTQDAPLPALPDNYILVKTKAGILPFLLRSAAPFPHSLN
jgi:hypothetical protein